jgi:NAD(P)-dependent dehydrogenase (short-subunit alcohol dehydrogenase family)
MTDEILEKLGAGAGISAAEAEALMVSVVPFKRRGSPLDVASMVLFLASDESSYVTGSDFKVDGGWLVRNAG